MISRIPSFLILLSVWAFLCGHSAALAKDENAIRRAVSMEWDSVPDSLGYQLEVTRILKNGKRKAALFFKTKKPQWQGKVAAGRYEVRLRSLDEREVYGDWSPPIEIWARLPDPELTAPKSDQSFNASSDTEADVEFQWQKVVGAKGYWIEIQYDGGEKLHSEFVSDSETKVSLKVAQSYLWHVTTVMPEEEKPPLDKSFERKFTLVGAPLASPNISRPTTKFVTTIKWDPSKYAQSYALKLERQANGKWITLEDQPQFTGALFEMNPTYPGGTLRLTVSAHAPLRLQSPVAQIEFPVYDGVRTPDEIERAKLREAIERETDGLFVASYLLSSIDYQGTNRESGRRAKFSALTGTGRIGYAFVPKSSHWGFSTMADLGGMLIKDKNHLFYSLEAQALWRKYIWDVTQLRLYAGVFARQVPEAIKKSGDVLTVKDVGVLGPHLGVQFWHPFSYRFGVQLNMQLLLGMSAIKTPNGQPVIMTPSYQLGLLGSYKMKDNLTGYAGYAYRVDNVSYKAKPYDGTDLDNVANAGDINEITYQGHYLNMLLEWGF